MTLPPAYKSWTEVSMTMGLVEPIHDRMLPIVNFADGERFLRSDDLSYLPYSRC